MDILENLIAGIDVSKITTSQKLSADISNDGSIDQADLNELEVVFSSTSEDSEQEEESFVLGDVNNDGQINITDVISVINYILVDSAQNYNIALDLTEDGNVNITDVIQLVNQILQTSTDNDESRDNNDLSLFIGDITQEEDRR